MPVDSAADLVNALRLSQLLAPAQLEDVAQKLLPSCHDARALARALLEREWLTAYQVNMLLQGAGDKLLLAPYIILERLGDNVLGQVFKARHGLMNRAVSLTIIREELLAKPETVGQFYQEIQAVGQLSDPHIVHAYDAGPIGASHFFAMEYVDGIDLERLVLQSGRLPVGVACAFVHQVALGLQHAYERGLLHHDLRPANLLLAKLAGGGSTSITTRTPLPSPDQLRDANLKIANLGLTLLQPKLRRSAGASTEDSLDYVAPEQPQGAVAPDVRANLYSLGCVFYFLLTGRAPFAGSGSSVKLKQHQSEEPKPIDTFRRDVPPELRDIIRVLLAKSPQERYQTPADFLAALAGVSLRAPLPPKELPKKPPSGPVPRIAATLVGYHPTLRRYRRGLVAAGAAVALLLGLWLLWPAHRPPDETAKLAQGQGPVPTVPALPTYIKKATRLESIQATLKANGLPDFEGKWWSIAPFDNPPGGAGFDAVYPPEKEINLAASYTGKDNLPAKWQEWPGFRYGVVQDLRQRSPRHDNVVIYLYHEFDAPQEAAVQVSFGSDDTLTVWLNGERVVSQNVYRGAAPDQAVPTLNVRPGKNRLLLKICQGGGGWEVYVMPRWPDWLKGKFEASLDRDFPRR